MLIVVLFTSMSRKAIIVLILVLLAAAFAFAFSFFKIGSLPKRLKDIPQAIPQKENVESNEENRDTAPIWEIAANLEVPWALAFLPDGSLIVTERKGTVRLIDKNGNLIKDPVATIAVKQIAESGLHGITLHPDFNVNHFLYLYYTYSSNGQNTLNRVSRFVFENNTLSNETVIVDTIPGAQFHDGGRIKFGPDKKLYITTGDALEPSLAQDTNSLAGKILRVNDDGSPVSTNPFTSRVYSYGHRNPQGITWDDTGRLWETEHGQTNTDELNRIEPGKNYGWPVIRGAESQKGLESPIEQSGQNTWAPAGAAYLNGSIFFAGLRGQALFEAKIENGKVALLEHFKGELGRIREVIVGPDDMLYITTSNRDGRGIPLPGDDKILRVNPQKL